MGYSQLRMFGSLFTHHKSMDVIAYFLGIGVAHIHCLTEQ